MAKSSQKNHLDQVNHIEFNEIPKIIFQHDGSNINFSYKDSGYNITNKEVILSIPAKHPQ